MPAPFPPGGRRASFRKEQIESSRMEVRQGTTVCTLGLSARRPPGRSPPATAAEQGQSPTTTDASSGEWRPRQDNTDGTVVRTGRVIADYEDHQPGQGRHQINLALPGGGNSRRSHAAPLALWNQPGLKGGQRRRSCGTVEQVNSWFTAAAGLLGAEG